MKEGLPVSEVTFDSYPFLSLTDRCRMSLVCSVGCTTPGSGATRLSPVSPNELGADSKNPQRFLQGPPRTLFSTPAPFGRV
jgi:hypothetical protein